MVNFVDERARLYNQRQRIIDAFNILKEVYYEANEAGAPKVSIEHAMTATRRALEYVDDELSMAERSVQSEH